MVGQVAIEVKNANDLPKLVEGLKRLSKSDLVLQSNTSSQVQVNCALSYNLLMILANCRILKKSMPGFHRGSPILWSLKTVELSVELSPVGEGRN